jgi:hypothetical protein
VCVCVQPWDDSDNITGVIRRSNSGIY